MFGIIPYPLFTNFRMLLIKMFLSQLIIGFRLNSLQINRSCDSILHTYFISTFISMYFFWNNFLLRSSKTYIRMNPTTFELNLLTESETCGNGWNTYCPLYFPFLHCDAIFNCIVIRIKEFFWPSQGRIRKKTIRIIPRILIDFISNPPTCGSVAGIAGPLDLLVMASSFERI